MKELVSANQFGKEVTTSLLVAEVFEKYHGKVLRDIETLSCSEEFNRANFGLIEYTDKMGRIQKAYEMTKDGFSFLVMGYTGEKAAQFKEMFIKEFNKREALLKSDDYILLRASQIQQKRIENLQAQLQEKALLLEVANQKIDEDAPKVDYYHRITDSVTTFIPTDIAKIFGHSAQWMNSKLKNCGLIYRISNNWYVRSPYDRCGLHKVKTYPYSRKDGTNGTRHQLEWTEKGREFIEALVDTAFNMTSACNIMRQKYGKPKGGAKV